MREAADAWEAIQHASEDFMKKHILVVDDEIGALTLIGIMLERGGFGVLKAKDAKSALVVLDQNTPDMIILDVMMPGMDGIELCRVIRERKDTHGTPILILSARGDAESIMRGIEAGANDYLPKPILHHDLVAKVRLMLGQTDTAA
jgi:DNA-binding response OmpR family regulator